MPVKPPSTRVRRVLCLTAPLLLYAATVRILVDVPWAFVQSWPAWPPVDGFTLAWVSLVFGMLGASAVAWSGARTRRKLSGSCPRCAYDLTGLPSTICPECGTDFVRRRGQLTRAQVRRTRILACGMIVCLVFFAAAASRLHVYYDTTSGFVLISVCRESDTDPAVRMAGVRPGMSLDEVEDIAGKHTGRCATSWGRNRAARMEQTVYFGAWPTQYRVGLLPPVARTIAYSIWTSGPSVRLGADGRVEEIRLTRAVPDHMLRLW